MVRSAGRLLNRIAAGIAQDMTNLRCHLRAISSDPVGHGLHTYRFEEPGGKVRLHLRVHKDGSGLIFVNATQALHLSATQAQIAKMVLDEVPAAEALERLTVYYPQIPRAELAAQLNKMQKAMATLSRPSTGCPACDAGLPQLPAFSISSQAPYKADLALHYACNNACSHCYNEPGRKAMRSLQVGQWEQILDELYGVGVPYVIFTGGEPTLYEGLPRLVRHAEKLGQITGVNTNGRLLGKDGLAGKLARAGLGHVQVTLNSHREQVHNRIVGAKAFEETVQGIRASLDSGLHTLTNSTLITDNVHEALELVEFLHELGLRTFAMNGMIYSGCGARHPAALDEQKLEPVLVAVRDRADQLGMRFLWYTPTRYCRMSPLELGLGVRCCNAAEYSICIEPDGSVLPCQSYYEPVGKLLEDGWEQIWNCDLFRRFRERRSYPQKCGLPPECHECDWLQMCGGGCVLERENGCAHAAGGWL